MKIEMNKKYRTRDGRPVRIICTDRIHPVYTIVGFINHEGIEVLYLWAGNGKSSITNEKSDLDLVEVSPYKHLKIDDKVIVWNDFGDFKKRHFAGIAEDGFAKTFNNGSWKNCLSAKDFIAQYPDEAQKMGLILSDTFVKFV